MPNRFYVQPGPNLLPGLQGLGQAIENYGQQREKQQEKERIEQIKQGAVEAYRSGDPDRMAEYALQNPEISELLLNQVKFRNEQTKDNYFQTAYSLIMDPSPENAIRVSKARQAYLKSQGQTADDMPYTSKFLGKFNANPEEAIKDIQMEVAGLDPKKWLEFRKSMAPLTETGKDTRTSEIKNIEYYNELKQQNPEMAEKFAELSGITKQPEQGTPTDVDDYVARANQESIRVTGKPLTPGQQNKAALEFKRAQAKEVEANKWAERNVEAATAEKIKFNERIGARLAEIQTEGDLIKAKGQITPAQKQGTARKRMEGNLAKLANHYVTLDSTGAMLNVDNTTFQNIMAAARSSSLGQMFGRITGSNEQSIRSAIKKLKPLLIQDIRQATDMGARGLDSEKELEFYLQAATDEKTDIQSNIAAIVVLDEAFGTGKVAAQLRNLTDESLIKRVSETGNLILNGTKPEKAKEVVTTDPAQMTDEELESFAFGGK